MKKVKITFVRKVQKTGMDIIFEAGEKYEANLHTIGFKGGFERYGQDGTMEGEISAGVIVEITMWFISVPSQQKAMGLFLSLELHYEVNIQAI